MLNKHTIQSKMSGTEELNEDDIYM